LSSRSDVLDVNYIDPSDQRPGGWALAYKWDTEKSRAQLGANQGRYTLDSLSYNLSIQGSYALHDTTNDRDLSTITAAVHLQRADFGELKRVDGVGYQKCLQPIADPKDANDREGIERADALQADCVRKYGVVVKSDSGAYYYALDFHGGLEGNQDYSERHGLFGLSAVYASEPSAQNAKFNIFDWPFAGLRSAFGNGTKYTAPFPSLRVTLDRLHADGDQQRIALAGPGDFTRASAELAFQTQLASINGQSIRFNASYRYFHELSAPQAIRAADLDRFDFLRASLRFPANLLPLFKTNDYEFFVGYTKGQLPFDLRGNQAVEVGITTNLSLLGELLGK
jgi:hypothetical protein